MLSRTLRVTTIHNNDQGVDLGPPHPSASLPRDCHDRPIHYPCASSGPHYKYGRVSSDSVTLSVTWITAPHKSSMCQYYSILAHRGPTDAVNNRLRRGYHLRSSEHDNRPLPTFPYGILHFPQIAPSSLIFVPHSDRYSLTT
jgi:hypothetical protein